MKIVNAARAKKDNLWIPLRFQNLKVFKHQNNRTGYINGGVGTDDHPHQKREGEIANHRAAEKIQGENRDKNSQ